MNSCVICDANNARSYDGMSVCRMCHEILRERIEAARRDGRQFTSSGLALEIRKEAGLTWPRKQVEAKGATDTP